MKFTKNYSDKTRLVAELLNSAEAIVVGAGSGLSSSAGLTYSGERFQNLFPDFIEKYKLKDMYSAGFYQFETLEEKWAYWSRHIYHNRYEYIEKSTYRDLLSLLNGKNYFVLTTNVDHAFQRSGFDETKLFFTQGDYGLWQCSTPCHKKTYENKDQVLKMLKAQSNMKIPTDLIPYCPVCKEPMTMNLRADSTFVEDELWEDSLKRYENFLNKNKISKIVFLELGVGGNTPGIIKYPFWHMCQSFKHSTYICVNKGQSFTAEKIVDKSICVDIDISDFITGLLDL